MQKKRRATETEGQRAERRKKNEKRVYKKVSMETREKNIKKSI